MAAVNKADEGPGYQRDSEEIGREIAEITSEFSHTVQIAGLKNDPIYPLLDVMLSSLKLQWRLHNMSVRYFHDVNDRLDRAYLDTIKRTELALKQAEAGLKTKQSDIVEQLVPRHTALVTDAVRQHWKIVKYRTLALSCIAVLLVALLPSAFTYTAGLSTGRSEGENAAHALQAAMAAGPNAATTWALLMMDNDPIPAMAACRKAIQMDADGRRYCSMPVWLDPRTAPTQ